MNEIIKKADLSFEQMLKASESIAKSKLFPQWDTTEKVMTLMMLCKSEGRDPLSAINRYDFINGRVAKRANAMLEDFVLSGGKVEWLKTDEKEARAKFYPPNGCPLELSVTWAEIVRAGLHIKDNYKKYPAQMLRARLISSALRMCFPTATGQLYAPEELEGGDFEDDKKEKKEIKTELFKKQETKQEQNEKIIEPEPVQEVIDVAVTEINQSTETVSKLAELPQDKLLGYLKSIKWIKNELQDLSDKQLKTISEKFEVFKEKVLNYKE